MNAISFTAWRDSVVRSHPPFGETWGWISARMPNCESDLERCFLLLVAWTWQDSRSVSYCGARLPQFDAADEGQFSIDIDQQVKVGRYRCDFLFTIKSTATGASRRIAVECDGHSFHERTPQQAARDRGRDRTLLREGISTIRYTYSEIVSDGQKACTDMLATVNSLAAELLKSERSIEARRRTINTISDPSVRKMVIMSWWERRELESAAVSGLIEEYGLEAA